MNLNFFYEVFLWPLLGVKFFTNCFKTEIIMVTRHCKRCHPLRNAYLGRSFPGIGWKRTYAASLGSSPMGPGVGGGGWLNIITAKTLAGSSFSRDCTCTLFFHCHQITGSYDHHCHHLCPCYHYL